MKLLRYGPRGREKPGLLDDKGILRDLSGTIADITPDILAPAALARLRQLDPLSLPVVEGAPRLGVPLCGIGKFLGVGLNYHSHSVDSKGQRPAEPIIFTKAISCLNGPNDDIMLPRYAQKPDWEVELGVVMGKTARYVTATDALDYVAGYVLVNDVSDRGFQNASGQWDKGKGCDTFGPVGPWLVTADEIPDPQAVTLALARNGEPMQADSTANMIFSVAELIANISSYITLEAGDIIASGTPRGVGADQRPEPVFLEPGDVLTLTGRGLGSQIQHVVAWTQEGVA